MKLDALFFAAHPDDIELCCGGIAAKMSKLGKKTGIIDLTSGELSTRGNIKIRKKEAQKAAKILGISTRINLAIPDGNIENSPKNRFKIIKIIREFRPEIIFIPHHYDRHPDHLHTNQLVKEAAFYSGLRKVKTTLNKKSQAPFRPKKNYYYMQTYAFEPNIIVDISDVYNIKMKSISSYKSQFYNPDSNEPESFICTPEFMKFIEARAIFYGFQAGIKYGEPIFTDEKVKLKPQELFNI